MQLLLHPKSCASYQDRKILFFFTALTLSGHYLTDVISVVNPLTRKQHLFTYSMQHSLSEKLTSPQLVKKFPEFYGSQRFITPFTTARHLSLSWARSVQSMPPSHLSEIHFNIILPSKPGFSKWSRTLRFLHRNPVCKALLSIRATYPAYLIIKLITRIMFVEEYRA